MIPLIGLMMGSYILTRMLQVMITRSESGSGVETITKLAAAATFVVTLGCIAGLIIAGFATGAPQLPSFP